MTSIPLSRTATRRLSVPVRDTRPPREITEVERATLLRIADCLIPAAGPNPAASDAEDYLKFLRLALAARADAFDAVMTAVAALAEVSGAELRAALKQMWATDKATFDPTTTSLAALVRGVVDDQLDGPTPNDGRSVGDLLDHIGGLGGKLRIIALAPRLLTGNIDLVRAQDTPNLLLVNVAQFGRDQPAHPARISRRRGTFQHCQNASGSLSGVLRLRARARLVGQARQSFAGITSPPSAHCVRHHIEIFGNRPRRASFCRQQNYPRTKRIALRRRGRPNPCLKHRSILRSYPDFYRLGNHPMLES